jgi:hypothetical protein
MATFFRSLRRLALAPSLASVTFAARGFPVTPSPAADRLEMIPQTVVCGFEWAMESRDQWELERRLDMVEPELRGFAYEGATMALTVLDSVHGHRTRDLLLGPGQPHILLSYIGIGFAMARLPRPLWKKVVPDLTGSPFYPTMSWLAVDGYAFDRAYFDTRRWVDEQQVPVPYPWEGSPDYFLRAVDQGIGRALWFIHGGVPDDVANAVYRFAQPRQADLWAGVGLAATFAGGTSRDGFARLREQAGPYAPDLAVGVVFAATARQAATFVPEHSETAAVAMIGMSTMDAVVLAGRVHPEPDPSVRTPHYEQWRQRIRAEFAKSPARSK